MNSADRTKESFLRVAGVGLAGLCGLNQLKAKTGKVTHQPGHLIDVMATCLELGGARRTQRHSAGRKSIP